MLFFAPRRISVVLSVMAAAVATIFIAVVPIGEAEAGFWCAGQNTGEWTIPADGTVAPPDARILTVFSNATGGGISTDTIVLVDGEDEEVEGDVELVAMGHRTGIFPEDYGEFLPDEPLVDGEYSLMIGADVLSTFSIDESYESAAEPEAVELQWYRETQNRGQEDECGGALSEMHYLSIEPLADEPAYYELLLTHSDGSETAQLIASDAYDGELRYYTFFDVECLSVTAHLSDGSSGEATEYCEPHKCVHEEYSEDTEFGASLGTTEWDEVSGCEYDNPGLIYAEDDEENGEDNGADDDNGGCTATSGSVPPVWMVILLALAVVFRPNGTNRELRASLRG